jgi:hypothetical protein
LDGIDEIGAAAADDAYEEAYYYYEDQNAAGGDDAADVSSAYDDAYVDVNGDPEMSTSYTSETLRHTNPSNLNERGNFLPLANDITLNRTKHLFSCKTKRHGRLSLYQELRQKAMTGDISNLEGIADDEVVSKFQAVSMKTDAVRAARGRQEATALRDKMGGKGMSASQRKAFAEKAKAEHVESGTSKSEQSTVTPKKPEVDVDSDNSGNDPGGTGKKSVLQTALEAKLKQRNRDQQPASDAPALSIQTAEETDYRLDCTALVCQSCKIFVREVVHAISAAAKNSELDVVTEVVNPSFCASKSLSTKYSALFDFLCASYFANPKLPYYNIVLDKLRGISDWNVAPASSDVISMAEDICVSTGSCTSQYFVVSFKPNRVEQEEWTTNCYICQAFGTQLEERLSLNRALNDKGIDELIQDICSFLPLVTPENFSACKEIYQGKAKMRTVGYMAKMLMDNLKKGKAPAKRFADGLCEVI